MTVSQLNYCRKILKEVGQAELDISSHLTEYEMAMENDITQQINSILEVGNQLHSYCFLKLTIVCICCLSHYVIIINVYFDEDVSLRVLYFSFVKLAMGTNTFYLYLLICFSVWINYFPLCFLLHQLCIGV